MFRSFFWHQSALSILISVTFPQNVCQVDIISATRYSIIFVANIISHYEMYDSDKTKNFILLPEPLRAWKYLNFHNWYIRLGNSWMFRNVMQYFEMHFHILDMHERGHMNTHICMRTYIHKHTHTDWKEKKKRKYRLEID